MDENNRLEEFLGGISKEDAFIAGVLSGVVLGCEAGFLEAGQDCDSVESQQKIRNLAQGLLETTDERLLSGATSALTRLRQDLGCSICWGIMKTPISLQCGHSFCHPCIATWTKAKPSCPVCRSPTLSYRSYNENVALRDLLKCLGVVSNEPDEETQKMLERLDEPDPVNELDNLSPVDRVLLNDIRTFGRVRAQGARRHPYQRDIRISLRQRERLRADREYVRNVYHDQITRELVQRLSVQDPRRIQLLQQLSRVSIWRDANNDNNGTSGGTAPFINHQTSQNVAHGVSVDRDPLHVRLNGLLDEIRSVGAELETHYANPSVPESVSPSRRSPTQQQQQQQQTQCYRSLLREIRSVTERRHTLRHTYRRVAERAANLAAETNGSRNQHSHENIWDVEDSDEDATTVSGGLESGEARRTCSNQQSPHRSLLEDIRGAAQNRRTRTVRSPRQIQTLRNQLLAQISTSFLQV